MRQALVAGMIAGVAFYAWAYILRLPGARSTATTELEERVEKLEARAIYLGERIDALYELQRKSH